MQASSEREERAEGSQGHASVATYVVIAAVLGVLTLAEVAVVHIEVLDPVAVPLLLTLTAGKFALVVMFYMHLRYDSRIFTGVFVAPLFLAMFVVIALILLFHLLPLYYVG